MVPAGAGDGESNGARCREVSGFGVRADGCGTAGPGLPVLAAVAPLVDWTVTSLVRFAASRWLCNGAEEGAVVERLPLIAGVVVSVCSSPPRSQVGG